MTDQYQKDIYAFKHSKDKVHQSLGKLHEQTIAECGHAIYFPVGYILAGPCTSYMLAECSVCTIKYLVRTVATEDKGVWTATTNSTEPEEVYSFITGEESQTTSGAVRKRVK